MSQNLKNAIDILADLPSDGDPRDQALIASMIAILNTHDLPYGLLISLCISCIMNQENSKESMIQFVNSLTMSYLQYRNDLMKIMEDGKKGTIH